MMRSTRKFNVNALIRLSKCSASVLIARLLSHSCLTLWVMNLFYGNRNTTDARLINVKPIENTPV